jgi:protein TonB
MPLRCLVFSSHEEMVEPIWQVLADLGVEAEYCASAVDAVERVTTQVFQIVVTDWDDQPEAAFLLKTAKDLKAAHRPLTLAIVGDDAKLPEALKAGANSVLVKPIRAEQVRDTMSTACELLRAKHQPPVQRTVAVAEAPEAGEAALTAAAGAGATISRPSSSVPSFSAPVVVAAAPSSVTQAPEKTFRAGEFLQPRSSALGAQFDTEEKETEVDKSVEQAGADKVEALTELEPMAAAVEESSEQESHLETQLETQSETQPETQSETQPEAQPPLTGWAALQARLTRSAPPPAKEIPAKSELMSYGDVSSSDAAETPSEADKNSAKQESPSQPETKSEAELFAYMSGDSGESSELAKPHSKRGRIILLAILAAACVLVAAVPRARQGAQTVTRSAVRAGGKWLNPPPAPVPQAAPQHDSFGQSGDEYKLPVVGNIPDATTDPSQIRVLPVVDPTAKPDKNAEANGGQVQTPDGNTGATDQNPPEPGPGESGQAVPNSIATSPTESEETPAKDSPAPESPAKDAPVPGIVERYSKTAEPAVASPVVQPNKTESQSATPQPRPSAPPPVQRPAPPHAVTVANNSGIPSSLRTQMASSTPEASGNKPPEAAMSSIEPVTLTESAVRELLMQPVDPEYPAGAKASGQRGSVVLQVIIGRDGAVRDVKFLQGSLVFARSAIDAVKQWRFKPYSMNGRAVSVQSAITLKFQPPA